MRFYIDACLPLDVAEAINAKRRHRATHATRDLGLPSRDDPFHVQNSGKRREILVTSNFHDFGQGFEWMRGHPGVVVFNFGKGAHSGDLIGGVYAMFWVMGYYRIGAKPPRAFSLGEARMVLSSSQVYFENSAAERLEPFGEARWTHVRKRTRSPSLGR